MPVSFPARVVIIGAGPSALFAARELLKIAKIQNKPITCTFLEKASVVGGKCHTYSDSNNPQLKTELGGGAGSS